MWRIGVVLCGSVLMAQSSPPAFPGAEGFGARTPGGRGGKVLLVRNLNDDGPGSFREAVTAKGPRTIVFRVGGLITLKSPVKITEPFLTVAGQTAPGDGICIRGSEVSIATHDVIVRYMRFRPGDISGGEVDALNIVGDSRDVIVDHCSATWSIDEDLSPSGAISNVTVQWCLIAEGLNRSIHSKGAHGYGSLVRASGGVSLHHNLWAHNEERNPRLGDNYGRPPYPVFDVRNNVMYDWGKLCSGWTGDHLSVNYVNNYIKPGPSSSVAERVISLLDSAEAKYYVSGNFVDLHPDWTANNLLLFNKPEAKGHKLYTVVDQPFEAPPVRITNAELALHDVLANVGCTIPHRDPVDDRITRDVLLRTGSLIDSQVEVGGWPAYNSARPPRDVDMDGIPDDWETAQKLNMNDPGHAKAVGPDGYTVLETYINGIPRVRK
jgi:pectate lyase